jgi:hypothetical protein
LIAHQRGCIQCHSLWTKSRIEHATSHVPEALKQDGRVFLHGRCPRLLNLTMKIGHSIISNKFAAPPHSPTSFFLIFGVDALKAPRSLGCMSTIGTFSYRYRVLVFNLLLAGVVGGLDPRWLEMLPVDVNLDFYLGVGIMVALFMEFAGIWFKSRLIFSFESSLHRNVPAYIGWTFLPRVLVSGAFATLALDIMGALAVSDFFLLPIILYATIKEFGVRTVLLDTVREKLPRPGGARLWLGDVLIFIAIAVAYAAIWKVYLLDNQHMMYVVISPINWGFTAATFFAMLFVLEMPFFWEEFLHGKSAGGRWFSILTILLPTLALIGRFAWMLRYD